MHSEKFDSVFYVLTWQQNQFLPLAEKVGAEIDIVPGRQLSTARERRITGAATINTWRRRYAETSRRRRWVLDGNLMEICASTSWSALSAHSQKVEGLIPWTLHALLGPMWVFSRHLGFHPQSQYLSAVPIEIVCLSVRPRGELAAWPGCSSPAGQAVIENGWILWSRQHSHLQVALSKEGGDPALLCKI